MNDPRSYQSLTAHGLHPAAARLVSATLLPCDDDHLDDECRTCGGTGEVTNVDTGGYGRFADCPDCGWLS